MNDQDYLNYEKFKIYAEQYNKRNSVPLETLHVSEINTEAILAAWNGPGKKSKRKLKSKKPKRERINNIKRVLVSIPLSILGALEVHLIYGLTNLIVSLLFWLISYIPIIKNIVRYLLTVGDNTADGFAMFVATMLAYLGFMATSEHVIKKGETKKFTLILTGIWLAVFNILFVIINLVYNDPILGNVLLAIAGTIIFFRGKNK
jgi:hypothetical protein